MDKIIRSRRRTVALVVNKDATVEVRAGMRFSLKFIEDFVNKNKLWIENKKTSMQKNHQLALSNKLSDEEKNTYKNKALEQISSRVKHFSDIMHVHYAGVKLTNAESCWGSCNVKKVLRVHWKLILAPPEILDYVVVHELSHLFERNHSKRFWAKVADILPDYKERRRWLKKYGHTL